MTDYELVVDGSNPARNSTNLNRLILQYNESTLSSTDLQHCSLGSCGETMSSQMALFIIMTLFLH